MATPLKVLGAFTGKRIGRLFNFGEGSRRHRYTLKRGRVSNKKALQNRQGKWWGPEWEWFPGGNPPRKQNKVTPLVDGENYFGALKEALAHAESYVFIIGWSITPNFPINREDESALVEGLLLKLLSQVADRAAVRILLWSGAPILFKPSTGEVKEAKNILEQKSKGDLKCYLDYSAPLTHCHHQKAIVIDGQIAFVGGMDLTTFQGDRFDLNLHKLRAGINWHDVQLKIEGEAVKDVEQNFRQRWSEVAKEQDRNLPPQREPFVDSNWNTPAQILRTVPRNVYKFAPHGEFGILHAYTTIIAEAKRFIYLENQYLWSPQVMDALITAINKPHSEHFRIVIVLPARAEDGKWNNDKHVQKLREIDNGRGLVSIYSLYTSGPNLGHCPFTYRAIYVHAKVAIVDDKWFTVGSANMNNRGLVTDGEINVLVKDEALAFKLRTELWAEHLGLPVEQIEKSDPITTIDSTWKELAESNKKIIEEKDRPLVSNVYPYKVGKMPGAWFLEELESLTFEH